MTRTRDGGRSLRRLYGLVWDFLEKIFVVPRQAPKLHDATQSFRPAPGFLGYLKFHFWFLLVLIDGLLAALWIFIAFTRPGLGALLAPVFLIVGVLPDVVAYVALHLRYDTTWYVLSDRSLRIRRGIWVIRETTITFENVQNVEIKQGPLQRWYGISNLVVGTAGGGGGGEEEGRENPHVSRIEGVADASGIRDQIMRRVRRSRQAGLGDEAESVDAAERWTDEHVGCLRSILDRVAALHDVVGGASR